MAWKDSLLFCTESSGLFEDLREIGNIHVISGNGERGKRVFGM